MSMMFYAKFSWFSFFWDIIENYGTNASHSINRPRQNVLEMSDNVIIKIAASNQTYGVYVYPIVVFYYL